MALRELEAWEERDRRLRLELKNTNSSEKSELTPRLTRIHEQKHYYESLAKDMKKEVKPSNLPDLLSTLVKY